MSNIAATMGARRGDFLQRPLTKRSGEAAATALMEFQTPTTSFLARPSPASSRATIWIIAAAVGSAVTAMSLCAVDRVVTAPGKVVAQTPNIVVQPLEASIVRGISVKEGQIVHAGDLLARLDPTFAAAEATASEAQMASLQAEVDRLEAEAQGRAYRSDGSTPAQLQAMIHAQRRAEQTAKLETYRQKIDSARSRVAQTQSDITGYAEQLRTATTKETMRRELERLQVGSKLNTLDAGAQRAEVERTLQAAHASNMAARSDLEALMSERDSAVEQYRRETLQQLTEQGRRLSDAREQRSKSALRRSLVDLRAECDAIVLSVARVSVGSVLQSGDEFITMVPIDAPLDIEASIAGRDAGFVQSGNPAVIKFDTFPYASYGYGRGIVTTVSADSFTNPQYAREHPSRPNGSRVEAAKDGAFYRASVSLDEMKLHHLPVRFHMAPGMPVTVDIKVGQRTVLAYLLSRVVPTLSEGMREP